MTEASAAASIIVLIICRGDLSSWVCDYVVITQRHVKSASGGLARLVRRLNDTKWTRSPLVAQNQTEAHVYVRRWLAIDCVNVWYCALEANPHSSRVIYPVEVMARFLPCRQIAPTCFFLFLSLSVFFSFPLFSFPTRESFFSSHVAHAQLQLEIQLGKRCD